MGVQDDNDSSGYVPPPKLADWAVPPIIRQTVLPYIGGNETGNRYDVMNGGGRFDVTGPHPLARGQVGPNGKSSASGYLQATRDTWNSIAGEEATMHPENQHRFGYKNASLGYSRLTGRDLVKDVEEQGLTPEIAKTLKTIWAGGPQNAAKVNWKMPDGSYNLPNDTLAQYGGSAPSRRESGNYQPSGGGAGDRWSEANIPFQQQATQTGLLGMLGVNTTENQRLAAMKGGFRGMQTPGNLGKSIGAGGEAYVDTLMALNKQQAEIAGMQTTGKMNEASGVRSRAEAEREKAQATKTTREAEFVGAEDSLEGKQIAKYGANNEFKGYTNVGFAPSTGAPGAAGTTAFPTFKTATGEEQPITAAPTDPLKMAPEVLRHQSELGSLSTADEEHNNKFKIISDMAQKAREYIGLGGKYSADNFRTGKEKFAADQQRYEDAASAARGNSIVNSDLIHAVTNIPEGGFLAAGKLADARYSLVNTANTIAAMTGSKERLIPSEWSKAIISQEELIKLGSLATHAGSNGNEAAKVYFNRLAANPSELLQKEVSARLVATNIVMLKAAEDNLKVGQIYGDSTRNAGNQLVSTVNKANPIKQYNRDIDALTHMLTNTKQGKNLVTMYKSGELTPDEFNKWGRKYGSGNLNRYLDQVPR